MNDDPGLSRLTESPAEEGGEAHRWVAAAARAGRAASQVLAGTLVAARNAALIAAARALRRNRAGILAANAEDCREARGTEAFLDRLRLDEKRLEAIAAGLEAVAGLPDPLHRVLAEWERPNGLRIQRVSMPLGVIGMIYESRPNVGADAAALCLKSGNAVILRGGSESLRSARALHAALLEGVREAGLPEAAIALVPSTDRRYVGAMLGAAGLIDLLIPRGGRSLVERVLAESRVPVLAHAEGLCHTYVHEAADPDMARRVVANAKMRRPGICGATETLLIDRAIAPRLLPLIIDDLAALGCRFRADPGARAICPALPPAAPEDFDTEWLDAVLSVKVVEGLEEALAHIARHGSSHTEAIITEDAEAAETFLRRLDSAVVMWNASTQFCDGGEFGFGAEIGIATGRIHARGPIGLEQLTTFRYIVRGRGQIRP